MTGKQASQHFEIKESTVELGDSELFGQGKIVHYLTVDLWTIVCLNSNVTKVWDGHFKTISGHFFTTNIEIFHKI